MTEMLVRVFVKNHNEIGNPIVRQKYGTLSSIVGIICNLVLFGLKYLIGTLANSISIVSDAFNNLSDCASCLVTLFGYKLASKPADKDHPFGHGRIEYLTSLIIAVIVVLVGIELLESSVKKILKPEELTFSIAALLALVFSIGVKLWMSFFNMKLGKKINSTVMIATAKDSRSDVIATAASLIALVASVFTKLPVDGIMGVIVSVFILRAGYEILKDTVDELLGKPADPEIVEEIKKHVTENEKIIGIHDLVIHNYGPGNMIGSCHVEVSADEDFTIVHDVVDEIERKIMHEMNIMMTIHMDPIATDDEFTNSSRELVSGILSEIDSSLSIHDFRTVHGETHTNLIFDIVVPYECSIENNIIKEMIDEKLSGEEINYYTVIVFDREYH
ncbi:MAG: cation transporter [Ruminococcus sp.]|nr:cation transporter [Ruminococcus sp.]